MAKLIGTAGHVDHGKTSLIRALTGIDADRLPEEKQRGMTIDIGFAFVVLPKAGRVSIVDVPGHEKFVTNMLVGALGIDVALLCVAADESVMPQTREHLQILELLPVDKLIVAMTRADLAEPDVRELAEMEIRELVAASRFKEAQIVPVSVVTGEGLDALRVALDEALGEGDDVRPAPWTMPIDRVFTVKGHGVVVTGTLAQGRVKVGDEGVLMPGDLKVRVRSIHWHDEAQESSEKGRRTALNLGGVKVEDVRRGMQVGAPGTVFETDCLDARFHAVGPVRHAMRIRVSIGAEEAIGKVFLSDETPDIVQLRLESTVACYLDQPLIVRRYSPPTVLGGGRVLVPVSKKRRRNEAVAKVETQGPDDERILAVLEDRVEGMDTSEICRLLGRTPQALGDIFEKLMRAEKVRGFAGLWFLPNALDQAHARLVDALDQLHAKQPTVAYQPREKALQIAKLPWQGKPLDRLVAAWVHEGKLAANGTAIRSPRFSLQLTPRQREFLDRVKAIMAKAGIQVPTPLELARELGTPPQAVEEIMRLGIEAGELVRVDAALTYTPQTLDELKQQVQTAFGTKPFAASDCRDLWNSSRKFVIPILEHFDAVGFTLRQGDQRVVRGGGA